MKLGHLKIGVIIMSALAFLTSGCTPNIKGQEYLEVEPKFDFQNYFTGEVKAWGVIQDRKGNIIKKLNATLVGTWEGNKGKLEEFFSYSDGSTEKRTWNVQKLADGSFEATAADIKGRATGQPFGNAIQWKYTMMVPVSGRTIAINFDDWMWAMEDGVLINRNYMKKFGFNVGEVTIYMKKNNPETKD